MRAAAAALLAAAAAPAGGTATKKGVVTLDAFTFDKVVDGRVVLAKFDVEYPYGDKEDAWKKFAARASRQREKAGVLLGEVGVQDYGDDKYNEQLRDRYGLKQDDLPAVRLFLPGKKEPVAFEGKFTAAGLTKFVNEQFPKADVGDAAEEKPPERLTVKSVEHEFLDGDYNLLDDAKNDEPMWGYTDLRIYANTQGTWMLSDESAMKDDTGYVYSRDQRGERWPHQHEEWMWYNGESKEWEDCNATSVTVSGRPAARAAPPA